MNPEPVRWWAVTLVFALLAALVPIPAWVIDDFYSRDMYPSLQRVMTSGTNILPFALLDLLLVALAVGVLYRTYRLFHVARQRGVIDAIWEAVRRIIRTVSIFVILFLWTWGFNYRRLPLETAVPGGVSHPTVDALKVAYRTRRSSRRACVRSCSRKAGSIRSRSTCASR